MKTKQTLLIVVFILIIGAIFFFQTPNEDKEIVGTLQDSEKTGLDVGQMAPDFILEDLSGKKVQLSDHRGKKVVVVNFWASWCPPCREEFPEFEDIFRDNQDVLEIIAVNLQEQEESIEGFLQEVPASFTIVLDPSEKVRGLYNVFTQPVTYFIDIEGKIVDKKFGPLTKTEIEEKFSKLGI